MPSLWDDYMNNKQSYGCMQYIPSTNTVTLASPTTTTTTTTTAPGMRINDAYYQRKAAESDAIWWIGQGYTNAPY